MVKSRNENKRPPEVPYIVHESTMCRMERIIRRLWILSIIMFIAFVISNICWMCYESQFETVEQTKVTQDVKSGNGNTFVSGIGDVDYGACETNDSDN